MSPDCSSGSHQALALQRRGMHFTRPSGRRWTRQLLCAAPLYLSDGELTPLHELPWHMAAHPMAARLPLGRGCTGQSLTCAAALRSLVVDDARRRLGLLRRVLQSMETGAWGPGGAVRGSWGPGGAVPCWIDFQHCQGCSPDTSHVYDLKCSKLLYVIGSHGPTQAY